MERLNRTTGRLLEPAFALLAAYTPAPVAITDETAPVNLLAHVPVFVLAFLLFSPSHSRLVRAALVPLAVASTFYLGFKFRHAGGPWGEKNKGLSMTACYWSMKAVELGFRRERPLWLGWEADEGQERKKRRAEANRVDSWRRRAYLALSYAYSYRTLGWSTGPSRARFCVPAPTSSRWLAARPHLLKAAGFYLLWDALIGLFALHPTLSTLASARTGSIYEPMSLPLGLLMPSWLSATTVALSWGVILYLAQAFPAALIGFGSILLSPDWRTTALHYPPLFNSWWSAQSMGELWGRRWHSLYRSTLLFIGFQPAAIVGGQLAGVLSTFVLSGLFHSVGYFTPGDPLDKVLAIKMLDFFLLCGLAVGAEAAFGRLTGRRVRGPLGRLWMWTVLLVVGTPLAEAWLRCGGAVGLGAGEEGSHHLPFGRPMVWLGRRLR